MAKFLLDTSVLISYSKGIEPTKSNISELLATQEIGVCAVTVAEFFTGLNNQLRAHWTEFFSGLFYWDIDFEASKQAGVFRYEYRKKGKQLATADSLIAAVALQEKATLVTANWKDFPMPEITTMEC